MIAIFDNSGNKIAIIGKRAKLQRLQTIITIKLAMSQHCKFYHYLNNIDFKITVV
jgi:rRNA processing protein Krr1/Pno1